ncbi:uncharacterized protein LOC110022412 isoform X2 [Phalaenopsis equestris]|uniref:uncharacterized protein LOC110022412 isoform X2 n=1 Tax=Phalaenopsis equestris TaxID=78828 RepID=UPI0009E23F2A|nr:uncharacterized protein LOC110022412 isoform X2 [Phalaenopsis equestris]
MARDTWMMDRAKEELKNLEAHHPSRFDYLKLELQSLISDYDLDPSFPNLLSSSSSPSAGTQVSSRKRRRGELRGEELGFGLEMEKKMRLSSEERAEMAIRRAKACLRRIQLVKESFLH